MTYLIDLITGNPESPEEKAASSTRFVFPFSYALKKYEGVEHGLFFEKNRKTGERWEARREYFTHEVREVLFSKTRWLHISTENWNKSTWNADIHLHIEKRAIPIRMQPPQLVLFEYPTEKKRANKYDKILQTGFLILDLYFPEFDNNKILLKDLLLLNDLFRYCQRPYPEHQDNFFQLLQEIPITYSGEKITVNDSKNTYKKAYYDRWANLLKLPIEDADQRYQLSIPAFDDRIYKDERVYVWSTAVLEEGGKNLQKKFGPPEPTVTTGLKPKLKAHHYGHWIKFLNVDSPEKSERQNHQATEFEKQWAKERTYHRWEESGTWYGFNYHSGVMLTSKEKAKPTRHFRDMYFDMALLFLYTRVTLFRYSQEIFDTQEQNRKQNKDLLKEYSNLRKSFLTFSIKYQFPLLSNQQQGIEMCKIVREYFDIDELYMEIEKEIEAIYNFVEMQEARELSHSANEIGKFGIPFIVAAFLGMLFSLDANQYPLYDLLYPYLYKHCEWFSLLPQQSHLLSWLSICFIIIMITPIAIYIYRKFLNYYKSKKKI